MNSKNPTRRAGWEILIFFALYIIAPSYLAIELHQKLPLITLSRFLLVLVAIGLLWRRRDLFHLRRPAFSTMNFQLTDDRFLRWGMLLFFALMFLVHLVLLPTDAAEAVKALFTLVVEWYMLTWMMTLLLDTKKKLLSALQVLAISAGCTGIVTLVGCILDTNPFHLLNTVQREMLMTTYYRLGVLRLEAGFGHPVYYGAFCAIVTPLQMYFFEEKKGWGNKLLYGGCLTLNIAAMILSNSRGSLLAFGCLVLLVAALQIRQKTFKRLILTYLPVIGAVIVVLLIVTAMTPTGTILLAGIANSLLAVFSNSDTLPPLPSPNEGASIDYGENVGGTRSRLVQMSGILYTLARKPLFGFGSNAHTRGLVKFEFRPNEWWTSKSFDMGLVSIVCQYGLIGLAAFTCLFGSLFKTITDKRYRKDKLMHSLGLSLIVYLLCLLTISSLSKMFWVLTASIICLVNIIRNEESAG